MAKKILEVYNTQRRLRLEEEHIEMIKKLRKRGFRKRAIDFLAKEILRHHQGAIDLVVADQSSKLFSALARKLGNGTKFRCLRANLRLDRGQTILLVQEIAFNRRCLEEVRTRILARKFAPKSRQLALLSVCVIASRTAIEIEGVPVVSLNNGCPCCEAAGVR